MKSKFNPFHSTALSGAAVVFACFSLFNPSAQAQSSWIGSATDHGILNGSNWTTGGVPGGFADVNFDINTVDGTMDLSGLTMTLGSLTLSSTLAVPITINTGNFIVGGGLIDLSASNVDLTINSAYNLWFPSANFNVGAGRTLTLNGAISDVGFTDDGPKPFTKNGAGTAVFSGANTYRGTTAVNQGKLVVNGSISTSVLTTVASGATLGGSGTVGALTVDSGAFVTPGNSPGILTVNGNYTQAGTYNAEITGTTAGSQYDQIAVTGAVDISGGSLVALFSSGSYALGDKLFILLNDGFDAITGTYSGFAQGATVATYGGFDWAISYLADSAGNTFIGGNDIALMAVPEPNAAALIGGFGVLALLRRRR
jgi:fibronectin-binding autotransporter adhesin